MGENINPPRRTLVVNFNSPELNYLALTLAENGLLSGYTRPYINKGRGWERALESLPLLGSTYASTFGRRRLHDKRLAKLTHEAGVLADMAVAAIGRLRFIPDRLRLRASYRLQEAVRRSVSREGGRLAREADCVVAYVGFGLPAFRAMQAHGSGKTILNYPIAHHRHHRNVRQEEQEREPAFASTWPGLDDWPNHYEEQIDREIQMADGILVGSSYVRESFALQGIDPAKVAVAPYGVDLATFCPASPIESRSKQFRAIFVGQLSQRKGISYLLRAYRRFRKPDTELTLVGNASGSPAPFRPYADMFRHASHQPRSSLAQMYRESDVFVFPTLVEGMPLVVLEAMACGLPVIVTPNGPGDIVRDGIDGFVVPARDEDAICDRLERLYRNRELRVEMGRNAAARASEYSWAAYADRAIRFLMSVRQTPVPAIG